MGELELRESTGGIQGSSSGFALLGWDTASLAELWGSGEKSLSLSCLAVPTVRTCDYHCRPPDSVSLRFLFTDFHKTKSIVLLEIACRGKGRAWQPDSFRGTQPHEQEEARQGCRECQVSWSLLVRAQDDLVILLLGLWPGVWKGCGGSDLSLPYRLGSSAGRTRRPLLPEAGFPRASTTCYRTFQGTPLIQKFFRTLYTLAERAGGGGYWTGVQPEIVQPRGVKSHSLELLCFLKQGNY